MIADRADVGIEMQTRQVARRFGSLAEARRLDSRRGGLEILPMFLRLRHRLLRGSAAPR